MTDFNRGVEAAASVFDMPIKRAMVELNRTSSRDWQAYCGAQNNLGYLQDLREKILSKKEAS